MTDDNGMGRSLKCWSCTSYSPGRCLKGLDGWPNMYLDCCPGGMYEPGTSAEEFGGDWREYHKAAEDGE